MKQGRQKEMLSDDHAQEDLFGARLFDGHLGFGLKLSFPSCVSSGSSSLSLSLISSHVELHTSSTRGCCQGASGFVGLAWVPPQRSRKLRPLAPGSCPNVSLWSWCEQEGLESLLWKRGCLSWHTGFPSP